MKNVKLILSVFALLLMLSCGGEEEVVTPEKKVITTVVLELTNFATEVASFTYRDLDGVGGNDPVVTPVELPINSLSFGQLTFLNEAVNPPININEEIDADKEGHQLFYIRNGVDLIVAYADGDGNNDPIGLSIVMRSGSAGSGNLIISLFSGVDKLAEGVREGNAANAGGQTDIQVTFPVTIE